MPLVWPGSTRSKSEGPADPNEIQFRDGVRVVPPHVAALLGGIDTVRFTYDEAVGAGNRKALADSVNAAFDRTVRSHFSEHGR